MEVYCNFFNFISHSFKILFNWHGIIRRRYYKSRKERSDTVRKHLTRGFLCAVLDLFGTLWPLLIPEYSGNKRRGTPSSFLGLRNPGISHYGDEYPLPFYEPHSKR